MDNLPNWLRQKDDAITAGMYRNIRRFREEPEEFKLVINIPKIDGSQIGSFNS